MVLLKISFHGVLIYLVLSIIPAEPVSLLACNRISALLFTVHLVISLQVNGISTYKYLTYAIQFQSCLIFLGIPNKCFRKKC